MISLSNLTKGFPNVFLNKQFSDSIVNVNAPISSLRAGFRKIVTYFKTNENKYDGICFAASNVDEILDLAISDAELGYDAVDMVNSGFSSSSESRVLELTEDNSIPIEEASASAIVNSLIDASSTYDTTGYSVTITDACGRAFNFITRPDVTAGYIVNLLISGIEYAFIGMQDGIFRMRKRIAAINYNELAVGALNKATSYFNLIKDLIKSSTVNTVLTDVCQAALSSRPAESVHSLVSRAESMGLSAKSIYRKIAYKVQSIYDQSGVRGLFSYVSSYFRSNSMTDSDGCLVYTDNSLLLPKEFISGLVSSFVSTITSVLSLVLAALGGVFVAIGAALGVIGGLIGQLFASIPSTSRASISEAESDEDQLQILPTSPVAFFKGSFDNTSSFSYLESAYLLDNSPLLFPVIGGQIIVGPGVVSADSGAIESWRWEFHPYAFPVNAGHAGLNLADISPNYSFITQGSLNGSDAWGLDLKALKTGRNSFNSHVFVHDYKTFWNRLISYNIQTETYSPNQAFLRVTDVTPNYGDGALSENDDARLAAGVICCAAMFGISVLCELNDFTDFGNYCVGLFNKPIISSDAPVGVIWDNDMGGLITTFNILWMNSLSSTIWQVALEYQQYKQHFSWKNLVECAQVVSDTAPSSNVKFYVYNTVISSWDGPRNLFLSPSPENVWRGLTNSRISSWPRGPYEVLPPNAKWAHKVPTYNSVTLLPNIILTCAVTAAVVAATVAISVSYSRWAKGRRARNVAAFNAAQADYQAAVRGERLVYNSETHSYDTYQVDLSSAEGKALVNDTWRAYKKQALKNNIWANFIGGSKYDVSSFWGELSEDEAREGSVMDSISSYSNYFFGSDELNDDSVLLSGDDLLRKLILGDPVRSE